MSEFERINRLPTYVFQEVNDLKAKLRNKGKDIIDFGMGNPDMPTPSHIREKLQDTVNKPGTATTNESSSSEHLLSNLTVTDIILTSLKTFCIFGIPNHIIAKINNIPKIPIRIFAIIFIIIYYTHKCLKKINKP